jgi:hypothetical protein
MTVKERLLQVKEFFFNTVPPVPPVQEFEPEGTPAPPAAYKLADGTEVSIDKLEAGGVVLIDGTPAPEGEHMLEDGTKIMVGVNGVISEVVAAQPPASATPPADDFTTPEGVQKAFQKFADGATPDLATLTAMVKALFENVFGWQLREVQERATRDAAIAAYQTKFEKQDNVITQLLQIVEELAATPVANPVEQPRNTFQKQAAEEKEERVVRMAAAWKQIREQV